MTSTLTNDDAERLLLDIRVGRNAALGLAGEQTGAFLVFPTSVVVAVPGRGQNVFPLRTAIEPGTLWREGGSCAISGRVDGIAVVGRFWWAVDGPGHPSPLMAASYRFVRSGNQVGRPEWADQLPGSQRLHGLRPATLQRQRIRLIGKARGAEHELLARTAKVLEHCCRGPLRRAITLRPTIEVADVVQRGMQVAGRLLPVYSSAARPPCSWLGMIQLDGRRDLHRAVTQLDWLPRDLAEVLARIDAAGIAAGQDPTLTLAAIVEAAVDHHQPVPRATPRQIEAALATPQLVPLDSLSSARSPADDARWASDAALDALDQQRGAVMARIGRLVEVEPALVVLAALGDDQAINRIGERVIAALRRPGETRATTRQRCRHEFHLAGRLFASAEGLGCFGEQARPADLADLDTTLSDMACRPAS